MSDPRRLRLRCGACGRNLADVRRDQFGRRYTVDQLQVEPRSGVRQDEYRPSTGEVETSDRRDLYGGPADERGGRPAAPESAEDAAAREALARLRRREPLNPVAPQPKTPAPRGPRVLPDGRREGVDFDWRDRTYTWYCRGGHGPYSRRHQWVGEQWAQMDDVTDPRARVLYLDA